MPWTRDQYRLAQAVRHGFKPTGSAKGFSKSFAEQVVSEGVKDGKEKRKRRGTLGDLGSARMGR